MKDLKTAVEELKKPFHANEIEWRVQSCGEKDGNIWAMVLAYVQNRAIMDRLDEVVGVENWKPVIKEISGGFVCSLAIKINGEWIEKSDGADRTDIEPIKGGISNAMKRAAVHWGIGRYLYHLDVEFADVSKTKKNGWRKGKTKSGAYFYWKVPTLPEWALPSGSHNNATDDKKDKTDTNTPEKAKSILEEELERFVADFEKMGFKYSAVEKSVIKSYKHTIKEMTMDEIKEVRQIMNMEK